MELFTRARLRLPQIPDRLLLARALERQLRFPFVLARGTSGAAWLCGIGPGWGYISGTGSAAGSQVHSRAAWD